MSYLLMVDTCHISACPSGGQHNSDGSAHLSQMMSDCLIVGRYVTLSVTQNVNACTKT